MEKMSSGEKSLDNFVIKMPISEAIFDSNNSPISEIFRDEILSPLINIQIDERKIQTRNIVNVLKKLPEISTLDDIDRDELADFYNSLSQIISEKDYRRLILYLPFEVLLDKNMKLDDYELVKSVDYFKQTYLKSWCELLNIHDMRANFVDGDILESEARSCDPPRVVKAAHLIPWLVRSGTININDVKELIQVDDLILKRSIADTIPALFNFGLLSDDDFEYFQNIAISLPEEPPREPLFISESRKSWLDSKGNTLNIKPIENQNILGDFSENTELIRRSITEIQTKLHQLKSENIYKIALIGGSRVKGYGGSDSDTDIYFFIKDNTSAEEWHSVCELFDNYEPIPIHLNDKKIVDPIEKWSHTIFNNFWIGSEIDVAPLRSEIMSSYLFEEKEKTRLRSIESLEGDLLLYRLLHSGYSRVCDFETMSFSDKKTMGEQSPFYDSGYRRLATELYVKRVFIPDLSVKNRPL